MSELKIYTIGAIKDVSLDEAMAWRDELSLWFETHSDKKMKLIHPPLFYNYERKNHKTEKEIKDWELTQLKKCSVAVVNLDKINDSVGSHYELATADMINRMGGDIFIIGFGNTENVHPWILDSMFRIEESIADIGYYILDYLDI